MMKSNTGKLKPRAYGVAFKDSKGVTHMAYLNKGSKNEIILSAGALGSPQLLMLSGVGPAEHLLSKGIKLVLHLPMVGQGMADNPMNALVIPSPQPLEISLIQTVGITPFGSYVEAASGTLELAWARNLPAQLLNQVCCPFLIHDVKEFNLRILLCIVINLC